MDMGIVFAVHSADSSRKGNDFVAPLEFVRIIFLFVYLIAPYGEIVHRAFRQIGDANYEYVIPYLMLAAVYLVLVLIITALVKFLERRMGKSDRRN